MLLLVAVFLWIVGLSFFTHAFFWTIEQLLLASGLPWPAWAWLFIAIAQGLALLVPAAALAVFWPNERARAIYRTWAVGAVFVLIMAPLRLIQAPSVIAANVLQIGLISLAICLILLMQYLLGRTFHRPSISASFWLALLIAVLAAYPWLMWGALGSPLDTVLNLVAALLFGLLVALILDWFLLDPIQGSSITSIRGILLGGLAAVALLVEMTSAYGFSGLQLLLMIVVPSFGLAAAAVFWFPGRDNVAGRTIPVATLIGLVAAAPSMLIDPDEMALILAIGARELLQWALYAALVSATIGWLAGIILVGFWPQIKNLYRRPVLTVSALVAFALGVILYGAVGQPGFHGEQLFVILNDQADLGPVTSLDDLGARRTAAYETLVDHANVSQNDLRQTMDRFGIDHQPYYLVNSLIVEGGPLLSLWLSSRPEVDRVLQNPVLRPLRAPSPLASGSAGAPNTVPWNLQLIGADRVWLEFGITGESVIIGQSDSGVEGTHPELSDSYRGRSIGDDYNWYDPWNGSGQPTDIGGHGTHTLGSILGANTGVAPGAEWIGCVNLARNLANPSLYLDCLQFMLAPFPAGGDPLVDGDPLLAADVLNNSWGCPPIEGCDPNSLLDAARALRQAGIFVVVSAGNEGPFCESVSHPLALYDEVLSVGAVDQDGALAIFSSIGPVSADGSLRTKPDVLAPGVNILSAFTGASYEHLDGTSMAGPHVAGVVALMWSANPALKGDIERTEQILRETASEYQGLPPDCGDQAQLPYNGIGYGMVDAYAAVESALALSTQD